MILRFVFKEKNAGGGSQAEEWAGSNLRGRDRKGTVISQMCSWFIVDGRVNR